MIPSGTRQIAGLVFWLAVPFAAAAIGGVATMSAGPFYSQIVRPEWAPPGWLFGPVWTALYAMMGVAAWLVWRVGGFRGAKAAIVLFLVQLAFNALWSWLFFRWQLGAVSFVEIVLLWALILATIAAFRRISPVAGALLVPYLLWVTYASALTYSVWRMNPRILG